MSHLTYSWDYFHSKFLLPCIRVLRFSGSSGKFEPLWKHFRETSAKSENPIAFRFIALHFTDYFVLRSQQYSIFIKYGSFSRNAVSWDLDFDVSIVYWQSADYALHIDYQFSKMWALIGGFQSLHFRCEGDSSGGDVVVFLDRGYPFLIRISVFGEIFRKQPLWPGISNSSSHSQ